MYSKQTSCVKLVKLCVAFTVFNPCLPDLRGVETFDSHEADYRIEHLYARISESNYVQCSILRNAILLLHIINNPNEHKLRYVY